MDSCKTNLVLGNFAKKLGLGQTPPPGWDKIPTVANFFLKAPLSVKWFGGPIGPSILDLYKSAFLQPFVKKNPAHQKILLAQNIS